MTRRRLLTPFNDSEEFLVKFDLNTPPPYENTTRLTDRRVGFSVQRQYPLNILFKPARTLSGRDDTVALIHAIYTHPAEESVDLQNVPITLRVHCHSRYSSAHVGFNYSDPDCPTK